MIVPVHDCRDTVGRALESVFAQTLPAERIEIIAVDDGSADGGAELLDELARGHDRLTVVHQPHSGGPGGPRNRGLELASGTFVFFLDADDALGPEALERMTAMAERNGTDVVLGKQVGTGGRKVPRMFERTIERTHVLDPGCDLFPRMSMAALQLFRRSLIEQNGPLRFTEGLLSHEDQLFTAGAYLAASGVSVLADYDCYYWAARTDGTSATQTGGAGPADVYAIIARAMREVADRTVPGEVRDRLQHRYLRLEVFGRLARLYLDSTPEDQKITLTNCRELLEKWYTPGVLELAHPSHRLLAHCLLNDLDDEFLEVLRFLQDGTRPRVLLEDGEAFLMYPFFRDASGIPDECFRSLDPPEIRPSPTRLAWEDGALRIDGTVVLRDVDEGAPAVRLLLDDGTGDPRPVECETVPASPTDLGTAATFTAAISPEPAALPDGRWTVSAEVSIEGHVRTIPLVKPSSLAVPRVALAGTRATGRRVIRPLPARGSGTLVLDVGGPLASGDFHDADVAWGPLNRVRVSAEAPPVLGDEPAMSLRLRHAHEGTVIRAALAAVPDDPSRRRADISLARSRPGHWGASFEVDGVGGPVPVRVAAGSDLPGPANASLVPPRRLRVRLDRGTLTVEVTAPLAARVRRVRQRLGARESGEELQSPSTPQST
ncbi:glycosyltransferase family 2 protein [Actinomadura sp. 9N215]|uniref:glycosyltransferase family 2 protein n=1 Tax=Actinomadura sp. 9N215 TaxID=3375150 RepID=UPI00379C534A